MEQKFEFEDKYRSTDERAQVIIAKTGKSRYRNDLVQDRIWAPQRSARNECGSSLEVVCDARDDVEEKQMSLEVSTWPPMHELFALSDLKYGSEEREWHTRWTEGSRRS